MNEVYGPVDSNSLCFIKRAIGSSNRLDSGAFPCGLWGLEADALMVARGEGVGGRLLLRLSSGAGAERTLRLLWLLWLLQAEAV